MFDVRYTIKGASEILGISRWKTRRLADGDGLVPFQRLAERYMELNPEAKHERDPDGRINCIWLTDGIRMVEGVRFGEPITNSNHRAWLLFHQFLADERCNPNGVDGVAWFYDVPREEVIAAYEYCHGILHGAKESQP